MVIMNREWEEIPCPECGAENVVIIGTKLQIPGRCKVCGRDVIFLYRPDGMPRTRKIDKKDGRNF
jgi:ribosomal protein S27E